MNSGFEYMCQDKFDTAVNISKNYYKSRSRNKKRTKIAKAQRARRLKEKQIKEANGRQREIAALIEEGLLDDVEHEVPIFPQNLSPQQTSSVLNDTAYRISQDSNISNVSPNASLNIDPLQVASTVFQDFDSSEVAPSILPDIGFSQQVSSILPDTNSSEVVSSTILPDANDSFSNYDPYTLPLIESDENYTLPVLYDADTGSYSSPKLFDANGLSLPIISRKYTKKLQTGSNDHSSTFPVNATASQNTTTTQRVRNATPFSVAAKKNSIPAKCSSTKEISRPPYDSKVTQTSNLEILPNQPGIRKRRIVDFDYFLKALKDVNKHNKFGCNLNDVIVMEEIKKGLRTSYRLKCTICGFQQQIWSECPREKENVNTDFIAGMLSINCNYSDMDKLLTRIGLPSLCEEFFINEQNKISLNEGMDESQNIKMSRKHQKITKTIEKNCKFVDKPQVAAYQTPFPLPKKTYQKIEEKPQVAIHQDSSFLIIHDKNAQKSDKNVELIGQPLIAPLKLPNETYEKISRQLGRNLHRSQIDFFRPALFTIPTKTYCKTSKKIGRSLEQRSHTVSDKNKFFENVDKVIIEDQLEIAVEKNDVKSEDKSEVIMPQQASIKTHEDKLVVDQEPEIFSVAKVKQEIISDDEDLIESKTNEMEILEKEIHNVCDDQSKNKRTFFRDLSPQQKKVRIDERTAIVDQGQVELQKTAGVKDDTKLVGFEFNNEKVTDKDGPEEIKTVTRSGRMVRANQKYNELSEKVTKPKLNMRAKIAHKKNVNRLYASKPHNSVFLQGKPTTSSSKERKFFIRRTGTNELVVGNKPVAAASTSACSVNNVFLVSMRGMTKYNVKGQQIAHKVSSGTYQSVSGAKLTPVASNEFQQQTSKLNSGLLPLVAQDSPSVNSTSTSSDNPSIILPDVSGETTVSTPTVVQQPVNSSNSIAPSTTDNARWIGRGNMNSDSSCKLPGGAPTGVSDPVPPKTQIEQSNHLSKHPKFHCVDCDINFKNYESLNSHKKSYCIKRLKHPPSSTVTNQMSINNSLQLPDFNHINHVTPSFKPLIEELLSAMTMKRSLLEASVKSALDAQYVINLHKSAQDLTRKAFKEFREALKKEKLLTPEASLEEQHIVSETRVQALMKAEAAHIQETYSAAAVEQALCRQKSAIEATVAASGHEQTALVSALRSLKEDQNCKHSMFQTQFENLVGETSFVQENLIDASLPLTTKLQQVTDSISSRSVPVQKASLTSLDDFIKQSSESQLHMSATSHNVSCIDILSEKLGAANSSEIKADALEAPSINSLQHTETNTAILCSNSDAPVSHGLHKNAFHNYIPPEKLLNLNIETESLISTSEYQKKSVSDYSPQLLELRNLNSKFFTVNSTGIVCQADKCLTPNIESQKLMDIDITQSETQVLTNKIL